MEPDPNVLAILQYIRFVFRIFVHGFVAAIIAASGAVAAVLTVKKGMPADWEWLIIAATAAGAFGNGVNSFIAKPEEK